MSQNPVSSPDVERPLKVVYFASAFWPHVGGVEEHVRQISHALTERSHTVRIVAQRWPRDLLTQEIFEGLDVRRMAFRAPASSLKSKINYLRTRAALVKEAVELARGFDLIHIECASTNTYYALEAARILQIPVALSAHGELTMDAGKLYEKSAHARTQLKRALAECAFVTACSGATLDDLEKWNGQSLGSRGHVLHNGIRLADFPASAVSTTENRIVWALGRLVPQKGFDVLLRSWADFQSKTAARGWKLKIAGDGMERGALHALAEELGVAESVEFVGQQGREGVEKGFAECDFFVLPSRLEPFGIVNLEAMAAGKAIIASRVGGVPEIVSDGENGLLFESENVSQLAAFVEQLATSPDLRHQLGENGRALVQNFDWSVVAARLEKLYYRALSQPRKTSAAESQTHRGKRDIVFFSLESWDEIWRRNQFLVAGMLQRGDARKVLFVEPPRIWALWLKRRLTGKKDRFASGKVEPLPDLSGGFRYAPLQVVPNTIALTRSFNVWHAKLQLKIIGKRLGLEPPLLWVNDHWTMPLVQDCKGQKLVYDVTDDWLEFERARGRRIRLQRADKWLCQNADWTIVCSQSLLESRQKRARHIELVPNGVDAAHYARVTNGEPPHSLARDWKKPVVGYVGTIHPQRVDIKMVVEVARALPEVTVALVGPLFLSEAERAELQGLSNVVMTGAVAYRDVPDIMRAFTICVTPHVETAFTQSLNPIKLGEYLAAGLPIVATNVAGFAELGESHPELCRVASGADNFINACRAALEEAQDVDLMEKHLRARRELARAMSWDERLDHIERLLETL